MIRVIGSAAAIVLFVLAACLGEGAVSAQTPAPPKADLTGQWTTTFDTMVGAQTYTFDFVLKGGALTGKMKGSLTDAPVDVENGKVEGDKVAFGETLSFQGMDIKITYTGTIASADEIKLTRQVGEFATEELVAKRVKK